MGKNDDIIINCYATGDVNGNNSVGGLAGYSSGDVNCCYSTGEVDGNTYVGGLVGYDYFSNINECYATSSVFGDVDVGGLIGYADETSSFNCYATGTINGDENIGGLVGTIFYGTVASNGYTYVWGEITNCYSTGSVSGNYNLGGLVGHKVKYSPIHHSYFLSPTDGGGPDNGFGLPLTAEQMKQQANFIDWDFVGESANGTDDFWDICDGTNYPRLAWQIPIAGDFNCPDGVDWFDLSLLCEYWLFEELSADVAPNGGDGFVNFLDWAIFADGWQTTVDFDDLADFADQWLKTGSNDLIADIAPAPDGDGIVDFLDFAALANNWLE